MSRTLAAALISLVSLVALAGCAAFQFGAPQTLSIKGSLGYRARIALPPETSAVVELKGTSDADERVVAEQRMELKGKQVPIPFELRLKRGDLVDGKQYSLRGAFYENGRATWVSDPVAIAPKAGVVDVGVLNMTPYTALAFASDLQCGDQRVTLGFVGEVMRLTAGNRAFDLRPIAAASGEKYEAIGDPSTTLWNKGDETTVVIEGKTYPACTKAGGGAAPFRATGNEPGWRIDIAESEMTFLTNYGKTRLVTATPAVEASAGARRYATKVGGSDLTVTIYDRPCVDNMSGMPHPNTVVVLFEGRTLNGCGGDPAALLRGGEWVVESLSGVRLVEKSRITLDFGADGQLSGSASCNRYGPGYVLTGEGLTLSKGCTTMMACDPPLMNQEQTFLDMLSKVQRFEMGPDGTLILHTGDSRTIKARRG
jgi:heat shock protein HslJ/uncharacterized lipoprotein YbaY